MAKPSDRIVHLTKSIAEVIQMRGVNILSRGHALVAVNIDLETVALIGTLHWKRRTQQAQSNMACGLLWRFLFQ